MTDTLNPPATGAKALRHQDRPIFGILLINLATVIFTAMDAVIKSVSDIFPTGQLVFFRNLFAFAPILIFMMSQGGITLRTQHLGGHLMRGLFGVCAMYCYFLSYKLLPLSEAIALGLSGPIFLTVLSIPFLGEKVGIRRWTACIVGFLGVLVMTRPGAGVWQSAALVPLLAAMFLALGAHATGASPLGALRAIARDARRHRSPNAGWPEAALAGALGLQLAGPRVYGDTLVHDAFMGDGRRDASADDIIRALRVYKAACAAQALVLLILVLIWRG